MVGLEGRIQIITRYYTPMKQFISLVLLLMAPMLTGADTADKAAQRPSLVVTAPVSKGIVNPLQTYVGTLYYDKQSKLASDQEGIVGELFVREGQTVEKGEVLVSLDSRILEANFAAKAAAYEGLKADLTRQERELERAKGLSKQNSISQSNFDRTFYAAEQLRAQVKAAKSELDALRIQLEKMKNKAPFNGLITTRNVEVGEWVGKGSIIATIVDPASIEARINIPAKLLDSLRSAENFQAKVGDKEITVRLKTLIPVADAATRTFPVEMEVPRDLGFIEGMRIDVQVPTLQEQESLMVPRDAVIRRFNQTVVFAAVQGKAVMIPVQVIGYKTDLAAIRASSIKEGMRIVVKGNERIFPNMPVQEKKAD